MLFLYTAVYEQHQMQQVITSATSLQSGPHGIVHHQLPGFQETFHSPGVLQGTRTYMPGHFGENTLQPRSVVPFASFEMNKPFSALSNTNQSEILNINDFSKIEEMLEKDNADDKHKHLVKQQIAKIQQAKAKEEKKLFKKEQQAHKDAIAYFEKLEEEKAMLKKQAER